MGGSGGGGGSWAPSFEIPKTSATTPGELVDEEIATTLRESKRVAELVHAIRQAKPGDFVVCSLNAGQGDCCVMRLPDGTIVVVDCNVRAANVNVVGFLQKAGIQRVDLLVLTHPDHDHVSGLPSLAAAFEIRAVVDGRFRKEGPDGDRAPGYAAYREALEALKHKGTEFLGRTPIANDKIQFGATEVRFLAPHAPMQAMEANEASLCLRVTSGGRSVIFGGDVTSEAWGHIHAREGAKLKSDVFFSSHHGAKSGCHPPAVAAIAPKLTVVSVGDNNYGHPHDEAMTCYKAYSGDVRRTDQGSIGIISRGGKTWTKII